MITPGDLPVVLGGGSPRDRCILPNRPGGLPVERSREEEKFEGDGVKGVLGGQF